MVLGIFQGNISGVALPNSGFRGQSVLDEGPQRFTVCLSPVDCRALGCTLPEIFSDLNNTSTFKAVASALNPKGFSAESTFGLRLLCHS